MNKKELITSSIEEISRLRRENEIMSAKLHVFDQLMLLFHTRPAYGQITEATDVVFHLQKELDRDARREAEIESALLKTMTEGEENGTEAH